MWESNIKRWKKKHYRWEGNMNKRWTNSTIGGKATSRDGQTEQHYRWEGNMTKRWTNSTTGGKVTSRDGQTVLHVERHTTRIKA